MNRKKVLYLSLLMGILLILPLFVFLSVGAGSFVFINNSPFHLNLAESNGVRSQIGPGDVVRGSLDCSGRCYAREIKVLIDEDEPLLQIASRLEWEDRGKVFEKKNVRIIESNWYERLWRPRFVIVVESTISTPIMPEQLLRLVEEGSDELLDSMTSLRTKAFSEAEVIVVSLLPYDMQVFAGDIGQVESREVLGDEMVTVEKGAIRRFEIETSSLNIFAEIRPGDSRILIESIYNVPDGASDYELVSASVAGDVIDLGGGAPLVSPEAVDWNMSGRRYVLVLRDRNYDFGEGMDISSLQPELAELEWVEYSKLFEVELSMARQTQLIKRASVRVVNAAPYPVVYSLGRSYTDDKDIVSGWFRLESGEVETFTHDFFNVEPRYYVYGHDGQMGADVESSREVSTAEIIGELYGDDSISVVFDGSTDNAGTGSKVYSITNEVFEYVDEGSSDDVDGWYWASFREAKRDRIGDSHLMVFQDPKCNGIVPNDRDSLAFLLSNAKSARERIMDRILFYRYWDTSPFLLPLLPSGGDDPAIVGVELSNVEIDMPTGFINPFRGGDIIIKVGDREVYGIHDIEHSLIDHGFNYARGIAVPVECRFIRDGLEYAGEFVYLMNEEYWLRFKEVNAGAAFESGFTTGISLGFMKGSGVSHGDVVADRFWSRQFYAANAQIYPDEFLMGDLIALVITPSRIALKPFLRARSVRRFANSMTGSILLEVGEGVVYSINTGSPLRTNEQLSEELKNVAVFSVGVGVISHALLRGVAKAKM